MNHFCSFNWYYFLLILRICSCGFSSRFEGSIKLSRILNESEENMEICNVMLHVGIIFVAISTEERVFNTIQVDYRLILGRKACTGNTYKVYWLRTYGNT